MPTVSKREIEQAEKLFNADYMGFVDRVENGLRNVINGTPFLFPDTREVFAVAMYMVAKKETMTNSASYLQAVIAATKRIYG